MNLNPVPGGVDYAVSYIVRDGAELRVSEQLSGGWIESNVAENETGAYFRSSDVGFDVDGSTVVVASEKGPQFFLASYTRSQPASRVSTQVTPVLIRRAFLLQWAEPEEGVLSQKLQFSPDLSDPGAWVDVNRDGARRDSDAETFQLFVDPEGASGFYRVLNISA